MNYACKSSSEQAYVLNTDNALEYTDDISGGQENVKIPFVNEVDNEKVPDYFEYTSHNVIGPGSFEEDFESVSHPCSCIGTCLLDTCTCLKRYGQNFEDHYLLEDAITTNAKPVVECSLFCTCNRTCPNRVTQHGIVHKLCVYKTKTKGFGVRALSRIPKLSFVCEYAGEVIGLEEANKRMQNRDVHHPNYVFILKEHCVDGNVIYTIVDPTNTGNVGRFLNHSCSPNIILIPIRSENMVPRLCMFSARELLPFEELCYDYGSNYMDIVHVLNRSSEVSSALDLKPCFCESVKCAKYLPFTCNI